MLSNDVHNIVIVGPEYLDYLATNPKGLHLSVILCFEEGDFNALTFASYASKKVSTVAIEELSASNNRKLLRFLDLGIQQTVKLDDCAIAHCKKRNLWMETAVDYC
jgi:hypothetical protein